MSTAPPSTGTTPTQQDHFSRRGSTASTELTPQEHAFPSGPMRSSVTLESILSPTSGPDSNRGDSPESRPPAKRLRVSLSPPATSEGWPSESLASESVTGSVSSPPATNRFSWKADPYQLDRDLTLHYINKYFNHVDSAATCILPRKAFLQWVKECTTKSMADKMLLYAIMTMGTVFAQRPDSKHHQDLFVDITNCAIMKSGDDFSLPLVQAKLILAQFAFSQGQYNQACEFCGSALRAAFSLKFNTEEGVGAAGDGGRLEFGLNFAALKECRRRTFWAAYIMDCFNSCCSESVAMVDRADCHLRLPCSQPAYEKGEVPRTAFTLHTSRRHSDPHPGIDQEISEIGVLGYFVEIATLFSEAVGRITKGAVEVSEPERLAAEKAHQDTVRRLDTWYRLMDEHVQQFRDGTEPVHGLHILYHYTAMISHRYVRDFGNTDVSISEYVQGAYKHARSMLKTVQRLNNREENENPSLRFAMLSPFSGFAITAALDITTAVGTMADLVSHESQMMSLISTGLEALEGLVDFWHSARRQRDMIKQRLGALLTATHSAAGFNGALYFGQPMQSPFGLGQDIVYGLSRPRYFEALGCEAVGWIATGWDNKILSDEDFRRLD